MLGKTPLGKPKGFMPTLRQKRQCVAENPLRKEVWFLLVLGWGRRTSVRTQTAKMDHAKPQPLLPDVWLHLQVAASLLGSPIKRHTQRQVFTPARKGNHTQVT